MKYVICMIAGAAGVIVGNILNDALLSSYVSNNRKLYCLLNGVVYGLLILIRGFSIGTLVYCLMASLLLIISIIDYHFYEIPGKLNLYLLILGIIFSIMEYNNWFEHVAGMFCVSSFLCVLLAQKHTKRNPETNYLTVVSSVQRDK